MASTREYIELIDRITEETQNHRIQWVRTKAPSHLIGTENNIAIVHVADYKNKKIRVYEEEYKDYTDEDIFRITSRPVIELIDDNGNAIWSFPEIRNSWNLLDAIRYEDAGVSQFMRDVLGSN